MAATKRKKPKLNGKPAKLSPRTTETDPQAHRGISFLTQRTAGVFVNEDTAMTQSTVWACIRVISETLAGMPWIAGLWDWSTLTVDPLPSHDVNYMLNFEPNEETRAFAFREVMWAWALGWGNGYAEIERDFRGDPIALWQLHPSRVRVVRNQAGTLLYEVTNDGEPPTYLRQRDVFHLMGPSPDGLVGWSVIRMHARTIGLAIAQEQNASSFNENDSTPGGILTMPGRLTETGRKNLDESWARRHRGPKNRRTVAILEEGLTWTPTSINPDDAKLVEQMQLTPSMICRIFRVPPHKIADLTRSTNNNIEHQDIEFVKDTLRPWAERGEAEADVKLFGRNNRGRIVTVMDLSERERGDSASQSTYVEKMVFSGVLTPNDGQRYLGKKPGGPEGDKRFIQSAMITLENAAKAPAPSAKPEPKSDESQMSVIIERSMAVIVCACRRMLRRESGQREQMGELSVEWLAKHRDYCREIIQPAANVIGACLSATPEAIAVAVSLFLDGHFAATGEATPESKADELMGYLTAAVNAKGAA